MKVEEKAVSKAQQALFGIALSVKRNEKKLEDVPSEHQEKVKGIVDSMDEKEIGKFAKTKTKDLPDKVEEALKNNRMPTLQDVYESYRPLGKTSAEFYIKGIIEQELYSWMKSRNSDSVEGSEDDKMKLAKKVKRAAGKMLNFPMLSLPPDITREEEEKLVKALKDWSFDDHIFKVSGSNGKYTIRPEEKVNEDSDGTVISEADLRKIAEYINELGYVATIPNETNMITTSTLIAPVANTLITDFMANMGYKIIINNRNMDAQISIYEEGEATLDSAVGRGEFSLGNDTSDSSDNTKGSGEKFGSLKKKKIGEEQMELSEYKDKIKGLLDEKYDENDMDQYDIIVDCFTAGTTPDECVKKL